MQPDLPDAQPWGWRWFCAALAVFLLAPLGNIDALGAETADTAAAAHFREKIAPLLARRCLSCHSEAEKKGGFSLETRDAALAGGDSGPVIFPGDVDSSYLVELITPESGRAEMPKDADPLSDDELALVRSWIAEGAAWPEGEKIDPARVASTDWWSLEPLERPALPALSDEDTARVRTPVDAFILAKLREQGLAPSSEADRRVLIRRLYYDLVGLPPSPEEVTQFVNDPDPLAYERLVDRLLESPRYGERWARHWLDVVHYGDTHGYDKDKPRPNAWPYRDYVIRSLNSDKPYAQFVREQLAGDVLYPNDPDGVVATGFIAAGPWDFISHVEVPEAKIDGQIARSLDRDDMVRTTLESFCSVTIGCARCHNHKFDPVTQQDYYSLQAVFAAVDRADRPFDADPEMRQRRQELVTRQLALTAARERWNKLVHDAVGDERAKIDSEIAAIDKLASAQARAEFGYHSAIEPVQDTVKWVQIDLGDLRELAAITYVGCHDDFNNIGAGFGFPLRYRIEVANDADFTQQVRVVADYTERDVPNPGVTPQRVVLADRPHARYVRITATKLAPRQNDFIFALAELQVAAPDGRNLASGAPVTALDSIEAPVRWQRANLVDGYYFGAALDLAQREPLIATRQKLIDEALSTEQRAERSAVEAELAAVESELERLPAPQLVFAAATSFAPQGNFKPTQGKPREIHVLRRGNVTQPGDLAEPGSLAALESLEHHFALSSQASEGDRRAALAQWIVDPKNPLTWRSVVNRVWLYHFGRALADSPNDLGRMGQPPTHPELLNWMAVEFRDKGQSLKALHRLICNSATYRQTSDQREEAAAVDADNRFLWRMNRRRLEAEAIRDSVLEIAGKLDRELYGPGFQDFVIDKPEHSPHYEYHLHDPEDPRTHRRSIYRFIVRSQQQPFMTTLDCADPSMQVEKRNETVTALQALALLNNKFMVAMSRHFAQRVSTLDSDPQQQVQHAFAMALGRPASCDEVTALVAYAQQHGLENLCRLLFNLNEFVFVD